MTFDKNIDHPGPNTGKYWAISNNPTGPIVLTLLVSKKVL